MTPEMMEALQMTVLIGAFALFAIAMAAVVAAIALIGLYRVLDELAGDVSCIRIEMEDRDEDDDSEPARGKPPDDPHAPADGKSRARMVRLAEERLIRRRSEAIE